MTALVIDERVWQAPRNRKTWAEVRTAVRSATRVRSALVLTDDDVDDCIDRAIEFAWPKAFQHELWKITAITDVPTSIDLPWSPFVTFNCFWYDLGEMAALNTGGALVPPHLWEVENTSWRWLGTDSQWLSSSNVLWTMEAIGKPRGQADETIYCPVQLEQLLPLVQIEVAYQLALQRGGDPLIQYQMVMNQRDQARKNMLRMRLPAHRSKFYICNVTTPVFQNWGQDDVTFADLH